MIKQTVPLIKQLGEMVKDIPGWIPVDQVYTLFNMVYHHPELEGDIVEIGSWCGRSAVILGHASRMLGKGKVYCVDLFPEKGDWYKNADGSYSFEVKIGNDKFSAYTVHTVWTEPYEKQILPVYEKYKGVLECFNDTIARNNLQHIVMAHRGNIRSFVNSLEPGFKCKLAFIDGDHGYEAVCQDIRLIEPFLVKGGWICFDDAFTTAEGVDKAITDCIIDDSQYEIAQQMTRKFFIARKKAM